MPEYIFLDFDGVVVDSIDECYEVSKHAYFGFAPIRDEAKVQELYYEHRGMVRPAQEYGCLFDAIVESLDKGEAVPEIFERIRVTKPKRYALFEQQFFGYRKELQKDQAKWLSLHRLTEYGKSLLNQDLSHYMIVTTKNKESVALLNQHYGIDIPDIYDKLDYRKQGSKGAILDAILDQNPAIEGGIFVDDAAEHLESVTNPKIKPLFCPWGYGENTHFEEFHF